MPAPSRPAIKVLADLLRLVDEVKRDEQSVPIEDALEGRCRRRWLRLEAEARRLVANQPS